MNPDSRNEPGPGQDSDRLAAVDAARASLAVRRMPRRGIQSRDDLKAEGLAVARGEMPVSDNTDLPDFSSIDLILPVHLGGIHDPFGDRQRIAA